MKSAIVFLLLPLIGVCDELKNASSTSYEGIVFQNKDDLYGSSAQRPPTQSITLKPTIVSTTPVLEMQSNTTADRIAAAGASSDEGRNCNCVRVDQCPLIGMRIVTPEGSCSEKNHILCCFAPQKNPAPTCGIRPNITETNNALKPGQAPFGHHPWTVAILDAATNLYIGGGVLLNNLHILTAAHILNDTYKSNPEGLKVRLGEWDASVKHEPYRHLDFNVTEVIVHPDFNPKNLKGDLAVLTLEEVVALQRNPHIAAVCLPGGDANFVGQRCWVSGWGKNAFQGGSLQEIMKHVDVPVVASDECEKRLRDTKLSQYFQLDRRSFLCAGGEPEKDACTGDGGSPLVCESTERPGQFYLAGLVAWGIGCATPEVPGVYVNVAGHAEWISEITANFKGLAY
ncbi:phenoloxidase-activating factor 2-like [Neocloeon triangulifer]|uniref:phenoloxidase-activating factor 2-like n=1 Tax=Neocloeon triangulifer TaxID=2078957 RepID=UPI00286F1F4D|nr:phenoloxidase-activating factor 2-like [Neocloeon triangulifer]